MADYKIISQEDWEQLPARQARKSDEWDGLLLDLQNGHIVSLPYSGDKDRRSKRITIARRAASRGFKTEIRYTDTIIAIRRADASPAPTADQPKRRGRRKEA